MKENKNKLFALIFSLVAIINTIAYILIKIIKKIKDKKNIYKKIKIVKEYEISLPKSMSNKETKEIVKEIIETDDNAIAYDWKNINSSKIYKLKKLNH